MMLRTCLFPLFCLFGFSLWHNAVRIAAIGATLGGTAISDAREVEVWLTTADLRQKLAPQTPLRLATSRPARPTHTIDPSTRYQTLLGFGASLEPATCWNLWQMDEPTREDTIARLVDPQRGIGMNLMRICIGTPDFTGDPWYSYNDLPAGEEDPDLSRFSIDKDRRYILPVLRQARRANPNLLFFASPWSPPGWMKSTGSLIGGRLLSAHYPAYARYFVRFIQAYEAEGIPIHAVTIQNEPGVDRATEPPKWHYPSCRWTGEQERDFIRDHLGPALRRAGLATRIWTYDHNFNEVATPGDPGIDYPTTVLRDPQAAAFIAGVAFHGYAGRPAGMSAFARRFPGVPIHFTEGSVFGLRGAVDLMEILRNGATSYNAWVTILDDARKPNNGPFEASETCIVLNRRTRRPEYRLDYYLYGHFMKFIERGAVRVAVAPANDAVQAVAFANPDGQMVLVAVNRGLWGRDLRVRCGNAGFEARLPGRSVGTYRW